MGELRRGSVVAGRYQLVDRLGCVDPGAEMMLVEPVRAELAEPVGASPAGTEPMEAEAIEPATPADPASFIEPTEPEPAVGAGAVDAVWRVWDRKDGRYLAARVIRQSAAGPLLRFVRERSGRFRHRHVVAPTGWAGEDDLVLFAMPLVRGGSVADLVAEYGRLPPDLVAVLLDQVFAGLAEAHDLDIVHGDVRASRLLLEATGTGFPRVRLSGFGLAAVTGEPAEDLSALGVVAAELLIGVAPAGVPVFSPAAERSAPLGVPVQLWDVLARLTDAGADHPPITAHQARAELAASSCLPVDWSEVPDEVKPEVVDRLPPYPPGWGPRGPIAIAPAGRVRELPAPLDLESDPDPGWFEADWSDPRRTDPDRSDPGRSDPGRSDPGRVAPNGVGAADSGRADSIWAPPGRRSPEPMSLYEPGSNGAGGLDGSAAAIGDVERAGDRGTGVGGFEDGESGRRHDGTFFASFEGEPGEWGDVTDADFVDADPRGHSDLLDRSDAPELPELPELPDLSGLDGRRRGLRPAAVTEALSGAKDRLEQLRRSRRDRRPGRRPTRLVEAGLPVLEPYTAVRLRSFGVHAVVIGAGLVLAAVVLFLFG